MEKRPALTRTKTKISKASELIDEDDPLLISCVGQEKALDLIFDFKEKLKIVEESSQTVLRCLASLGEAQKSAINAMNLLAPIFRSDSCIKEAMQAALGLHEVMSQGQGMLAGGLKDLLAGLVDCLPEGLLQETKNNKKKFDRELIEYISAKEAKISAEKKEKTKEKMAELDKAWDESHEELETGYRDLRKNLDISSMIMRKTTTDCLSQHLISHFHYYETGFTYLDKILKSEQFSNWRTHSLLLQRQIQYKKERPHPPPIRLFGVSVKDILEREQNPPGTPDIISCPAPLPTLLVAGGNGRCTARSRSFGHSPRTPPRSPSPINLSPRNPVCITESPNIALSPPLSPSSRLLPALPPRDPELQSKKGRSRRLKQGGSVVYPPREAPSLPSASFSHSERKFPDSPPPRAHESCRLASPPAFRTSISTNSLHLDNDRDEAGTGRRSGPLPTSSFIEVEVLMTPTLSRRMDVKNRLPRFMRKLVDYIMRYALDLEGIFRLSIAKEPLEKLVREINRGEDVDLGTAVRDNPHVACVLLKKFVREFPEPLCTFAFYSRFVGITECSQDEKIQRLKALFNELGDINRDCIQAISELCGMVIERAETNKMTATNLGVVFGPCLLYASNDPTSSAFTTESNEVFTFIFENHNEIFSEFLPLFAHRDTARGQNRSPPFQAADTTPPIQVPREVIPVKKPASAPTFTGQQEIAPPILAREPPPKPQTAPPKPQTPPKTKKEPPVMKNPVEDLALMSGALLKLNDGRHDREEREKRRRQRASSIALSNKAASTFKEKEGEDDLEV